MKNANIINGFHHEGSFFSTNNNGYFFKETDGKKVRISRDAFNVAMAEHEAQTEAKMHKAVEQMISEEELESKVTALEEEELKETAKELTKTSTKKEKKARKSKDIAYAYTENGQIILTLTAKQVNFVKHLKDTCFWERGLDSCIWVDCLCDEIKGEFAGKPMTVGAMISTLCEKGLGSRAKQRVNGKKCTSFSLTDLGKTVFTGWGLE